MRADKIPRSTAQSFAAEVFLLLFQAFPFLIYIPERSPDTVKKKHKKQNMVFCGKSLINKITDHPSYDYAENNR